MRTHFLCVCVFLSSHFPRLFLVVCLFIHPTTTTTTTTVPTAAILGEPDLHVDKGSTINLTCSVKYSPEPPAYIFWYHHDEVSVCTTDRYARREMRGVTGGIN